MCTHYSANHLYQAMRRSATDGACVYYASERNSFGLHSMFVHRSTKLSDVFRLLSVF